MATVTPWAYKRFVNAVCEYVICQLQFRGIPYVRREPNDDLTEDVERHHYYTRQLVFPWCGGDVIFGTLHTTDWEMVNGRRLYQYPSIESYQFPWDNDDVTVFDDPFEFVSLVHELWIKTEKEKEKQ